MNAFNGGWVSYPIFSDLYFILTSSQNINNSTRLVYTNGGFDPWRESGVSSTQRPGGPLNSTDQIPVNVVPGGFHTSDMLTANGQANAGCQAVINAEVAQIVEWAKQYTTGS